MIETPAAHRQASPRPRHPLPPLLAATPSTLLLLLCFTLAGEVSSQEWNHEVKLFCATLVSKPNKQKAATTPTGRNKKN